MRAIATVNLGNRKPKVSTFLKAKHPDITPCEILQIQYKINHRRLKECPTAFEYSITPETVEHYYNLIRKGQQMPEYTITSPNGIKTSLQKYLYHGTHRTDEENRIIKTRIIKHCKRNNTTNITSNTANSIISTLENTKTNTPLYIHQENPTSNVTTKIPVRNYLAKHNLTKEQQNTIIGRLYNYRYNNNLTEKNITQQELTYINENINIIKTPQETQTHLQEANYTQPKETKPPENKTWTVGSYQKNGNTINIRVKHKSLPTLTGVITLPNQVTVKWDIPQLNSDTPIDLNELEIMT